LLSLLTVPLVKMTKVAAQSIPNTAADTLVTIDTTTYDTDSMADTANNRLNINTAGKYLIGTHAQWATDATGWRLSRVKIVRSAVTSIIAEVRGVASGNQVSRVATTLYDCQVGDRLQLYVANNASAAINVLATGPSPGLWAFRIGT
jgi:hypothetical protein